MGGGVSLLCAQHSTLVTLAVLGEGAPTHIGAGWHPEEACRDGWVRRRRGTQAAPGSPSVTLSPTGAFARFPRFWPRALGIRPPHLAHFRLPSPDPSGSAIRAHFGSRRPCPGSLWRSAPVHLQSLRRLRRRRRCPLRPSLGRGSPFA